MPPDNSSRGQGHSAPRRKIMRLGGWTAFIALAGPSAAQVGTSGLVSVDATVDGYGGIRDYAGDARRIGVERPRLGADIQGVFVRDDQTGRSIDDGGCTLIDRRGRTWRRSFTGAVRANWFGALGDGSARVSDDCAPTPYDPRFQPGWDTQDFVGIQRALDFAGVSGVLWVSLDAGDFVLSKALRVKHSGMRMTGQSMQSTRLIQSAVKAGWFEEPSDRGQLVVGGRAYGSTNYGTGRTWRLQADGTFTADQTQGRSFDFAVDGVTISDLSIVGDRRGFFKGGHMTSSTLGPVRSDKGLNQAGLVMLGSPTRLARNLKALRVSVEEHSKQGISPGYLDGWEIENCFGTRCGWQFIGTDYGVKRGKITGCSAIDYADGVSENAFLDLEAGNGVDYEDITVENCTARSNEAGFIKLHPGEGRSISKILVRNCHADVAGARSFAYLELFGPGRISGVLFDRCTLLGARKHAFLFSCSGGQSDIAIRGSVRLEAGAQEFGQHVLFGRASIDGLQFESNRAIQVSGQSFLYQQPGTHCSNLTLRDNEGQFAGHASANFLVAAAGLSKVDWSNNNFLFTGKALRYAMVLGNDGGKAEAGLTEEFRFVGNVMHLNSAMMWLTYIPTGSANRFVFTGNDVAIDGPVTIDAIRLDGPLEQAVIKTNRIRLQQGTAFSVRGAKLEKPIESIGNVISGNGALGL